MLSLLWFPDVSFFFAARAESDVAFHVVQKFRCLIDHFTVVAELPGLWLEARLPVTLF